MIPSPQPNLLGSIPRATPRASRKQFRLRYQFRPYYDIVVEFDFSNRQTALLGLGRNLAHRNRRTGEVMIHLETEEKPR